MNSADGKRPGSARCIRQQPSARMTIPLVAVRGILALVRERSAGRRGASSWVGEA
jgi:hypothetical protein